MPWLKNFRCRWSHTESEEMPHGAAGRADNRTPPVVADPGDAQPTAEMLDLERSIARRARAASRDPHAAACESTERFRRATTTILFEKLRDLIGGRKSARH